MMKKIYIGLVLLILSVAVNADQNKDQIIKKLTDRLSLLEKQVELIDKKVALNRDWAALNRKLNESNTRIMKTLHQEELSKIDP